MKKFIKKIGWLFLALLPFLAAMAIQFSAALFCTFIVTIYTFLSDGSVRDLYYNILTGTQMNTFLMVLYGLCTALFLGVWYRVAATDSQARRRKPGQIFNGKLVLGCVMLVVALQYLTTYLVTFLSFIRPTWYQYYTDLVETAGLSDMSLLMTLYAILIAPVCEELTFRGVTLHYAKKALPFWAANLFQAVLFGIFHMNWIQGVYTALFGLILGYIFQRGGSIYLSIFAHILFNIWGSYLYWLMYGGDNTILLILQFAAGVLLLFAGFLVYNSGARKKAEVNSASHSGNSSPTTSC